MQLIRSAEFVSLQFQCLSGASSNDNHPLNFLLLYDIISRNFNMHVVKSILHRYKTSFCLSFWYITMSLHSTYGNNLYFYYVSQFNLKILSNLYIPCLFTFSMFNELFSYPLPCKKSPYNYYFISNLILYLIQLMNYQ